MHRLETALRQGGSPPCLRGAERAAAKGRAPVPKGAKGKSNEDEAQTVVKVWRGAVILRYALGERGPFVDGHNRHTCPRGKQD